jgi:protein-tyrosine phosphatase
MSSFRRTNQGEVARFRSQARRDFLYWVPSGGNFDAQLIVDRIWLGSIRAAFDRSSLILNGIRYALTVAEDMIQFDVETSTEHYVKEDVWFTQHAVLGVYDHTEEVILEQLDEAMNFLDACLEQPTGSVLVHCAAGVSRSATVVIAYLMVRKNMLLKDALEHVQRARPIVCPNPGFMEQLKEVERCQGNISLAKERYCEYKRIAHQMFILDKPI